MHIILPIIAALAIYFFLMSGTTAAPKVMTEDELLQEGLTKQEARRELRAQRQEARTHAITKAQSTRAAMQAGKITRGIMGNRK